ncbi:cation:dicarboxylase symporter family transporter [bacterium]|nr:cation:dicarboxylase symporter family transporter [bacterium]
MPLADGVAKCVEYFFTAPTHWVPWLWLVLAGGAILLIRGKGLGLRILGGMLDGPTPQRWRCLHTPGHAPGHLCLFEPSLKVLVVGDMVASVGTILIDPAGRLAWRTVFYYLLTTTIAVIIGLVLVSLVQPGAGIALPEGCGEAQTLPGAASLHEVMLSFIPTNPFAAAAEGKVLPMITWGLLLGAGIAAGGAKAQPLADVMDAGFTAIMKVTNWIVLLAPYGVLGILAHTVATRGLDMFVGIGSYMVVVVAGLAIHAFIVLPTIFSFTRRSIIKYASILSPALMNAFSTASSSATLPVTMEQVEKAGVSRRVSRSLLPLGATINMDGTALYEAVAVVFIAQVYGIELSLGALILVAVTATLASIGAAGIPEAGLVTMAMVLTAVGLPLEGVGLILGVDWFLDRCRTTVNVWGDAVGAAVVDKLESG